MLCLYLRLMNFLLAIISKCQLCSSFLKKVTRFWVPVFCRNGKLLITYSCQKQSCSCPYYTVSVAQVNLKLYALFPRFMEIWCGRYSTQRGKQVFHTQYCMGTVFVCAVAGYSSMCGVTHICKELIRYTVWTFLGVFVTLHANEAILCCAQYQLLLLNFKF